MSNEQTAVVPLPDLEVNQRLSDFHTYTAFQAALAQLGHLQHEVSNAADCVMSARRRVTWKMSNRHLFLPDGIDFELQEAVQEMRGAELRYLTTHGWFVAAKAVLDAFTSPAGLPPETDVMRAAYSRYEEASREWHTAFDAEFEARQAGRPVDELYNQQRSAHSEMYRALTEYNKLRLGGSAAAAAAAM